MWLKKKVFNNEKELNIYIKNVEKTIRGSLEYKEWLQLIRSKGGWKCSFTNITLEEATIEIHHTPYTLYDLVEILIYNQNQEFSTFSIAQQVMSLHFNDLVGWIALTKTLHEQVHFGTIIIPLDLIRGNFNKFSQVFTIPVDIYDRINQRIKLMQY